MELAETEREGASQLMKQHSITLKEGAVLLQAGKKLSLAYVVPLQRTESRYNRTGRAEDGKHLSIPE